MYGQKELKGAKDKVTGLMVYHHYLFQRNRLHRNIKIAILRFISFFLNYYLNFLYSQLCHQQAKKKKKSKDRVVTELGLL